MASVLYKVWKVRSGVKCKPGATYVDYDPVKGTWSYPLVEIISTLPDRWSREDMVNKDCERVRRFCDYLNEIADDDERYEVREATPPDHLF